jgi:hypothetical protein
MASRDEKRQLVRYLFLKLDPLWRRLSVDRQIEQKVELADTIRTFQARCLLRSYSTMGQNFGGLTSKCVWESRISIRGPVQHGRWGSGKRFYTSTDSTESTDSSGSRIFGFPNSPIPEFGTPKKIERDLSRSLEYSGAVPELYSTITVSSR